MTWGQMEGLWVTNPRVKSLGRRRPHAPVILSSQQLGAEPAALQRPRASAGPSNPQVNNNNKVMRRRERNGLDARSASRQRPLPTAPRTASRRKVPLPRHRLRTGAQGCISALRAGWLLNTDTSNNGMASGAADGCPAWPGQAPTPHHVCQQCFLLTLHTFHRPKHSRKGGGESNKTPTTGTGETFSP